MLSGFKRDHHHSFQTPTHTSYEDEPHTFHYHLPPTLKRSHQVVTTMKTRSDTFDLCFPQEDALDSFKSKHRRFKLRPKRIKREHHAAGLYADEHPNLFAGFKRTMQRNTRTKACSEIDPDEDFYLPRQSITPTSSMITEDSEIYHESDQESSRHFRPIPIRSIDLNPRAPNNLNLQYVFDTKPSWSPNLLSAFEAMPGE